MNPKRHFLVVAAASRGARLFVKMALEQGHDVTALCRAHGDRDALDRISKLVQDATLTPGGAPPAQIRGRLRARNCKILEADTYTTLLQADRSPARHSPGGDAKLDPPLPVTEAESIGDHLFADRQYQAASGQAAYAKPWSHVPSVTLRLATCGWPRGGQAWPVEPAQHAWHSRLR
jgi:hypothetical protein